MHVSPSCYIVLTVFKYSVTDDDVRNIETCLGKKKTVVIFLKITICFLLSRPFGSIIHDIAARCEGRFNLVCIVIKKSKTHNRIL